MKTILQKSLFAVMCLLCSIGLYAQQIAPQFVRGNLPLEQKATSSAGYEFGYCGEYYGTVGFGYDGVFYGLIQVTAEDATQFKGSQIDVVKVAFGEVPTNHNAHIVIFKSIDMYEAAPIYRQAFTPVPNSWTNVALNTPYTLDGEDVFIGYEIRATSNDYPIAVDNSVANSLGDIVGYYEESSDTYFFMHLASSNLGNNCIKLNISGGDLPQYDLALESVAVKQYVQTNTEFSVKGRVKNMAIQTINSFDCTVQIGDSNPIKHTVTIPDGLQNSKTFEFGIDNLIIAQEGETDIKVTISNPNGVADENEADNSIGQTIEALNKLLPRKTLVEDFSSTSYDNSVKVHTFMAELMENNDDIILVRHHPIHSDEFFINASSSYLKFNGGGMTFIPAMMIDRTNLADQGAIGYDMYGSATPAVGPMFSVRNKQSVEEYINYCLDKPSFVSVNIEDSYNPETRELTVRVFGEKVKDLTQAPRINIFITESNLVGYQAGASYNYKHNNIIRATLTNTWGDELKFAEDQYDVTYTYILDGAWKPENMDIVAFVAGYDSGNINNCNVYNTEVKEIEYEYVPTDPTPTASSVQFVYKGEVLEKGAVVNVLNYEEIMGTMFWNVAFQNNTGADVNVTVSYETIYNKYSDCDYVTLEHQNAHYMDETPPFVIDSKGNAQGNFSTSFSIVSQWIYGNNDAYAEVVYFLKNTADANDYTYVTVIYDLAAAIANPDEGGDDSGDDSGDDNDLPENQFEVDGIRYEIVSDIDMSVMVTYRTNEDDYIIPYQGVVNIPSSVVYNDETYRVTSIGDYAFYASDITEVTIPESITSIAYYAFKECYNLSTVYYNAVDCNTSFREFKSLKNVVIGDSVQVIPSNFLYGCSGLTEVILPEGITTIDDYAFYGCSGLTEITIPNSVTTIGYGAFSRCDNITTLYYNATNCNTSFREFKSLKNVVIGDSVQVIPDYFLNGCSGLTEITIPNSVTLIGYGAFENCSGLTEITIPNSVTTIEGRAFSGCSGLTEVILPEGITTIKDYTFANCNGLTEITIPNSVTTIEGGAFSACSGLTEVILPEGITTINDYTFYGCSGLTEITIPNSVTTIEGSAFYGCSGLAEITIPNSVTSIGYGAFEYCSGLTEVTISANVASIGELAFGGCTRIKNVYAYPLVPPVLETSSFDVYVNDNATLHVVENCKSAYEKASAWRYFLLIVEDLEVGSGVQDAWSQNSSVRAYGDNGDIVVTGCNEGDCITIYNSCGSMLHTKNAADNTVRISINAGGIYLVKVGDAVMRVLL